MRKIIVARKVSKNILVVADTLRMRQLMGKIRELGCECTLTENPGEAMTSLRAGERVNVLIVDLKSATSAEKLIRWTRENRPGVRTVCVSDTTDLSQVLRTIRDILEPANPMGIMR